MFVYKEKIQYSNIQLCNYIQWKLRGKYYGFIVL